jgi:hypothetical protein
VLGEVAGPAGRLVPAPGGGQRRDRQQQNGAELEPALEALGRGRRVLAALDELVGRVGMDLFHAHQTTSTR